MCADDNDSTALDVKIGTHFRDILSHLGKTYEDKMSIYTGSVLNGFTMKTDNFSISEHISSIGVNEELIKEEVCIKCGLCNDICPVGILPQNIMDAELRMVEERLYEYNLKSCIECGLCSYTCPSEINVLEWVRRAKRRVSRG
jgi:electron transport complex protein RnfC